MPVSSNCVAMPVWSRNWRTWLVSAGSSPWSSSTAGRSERAMASSSSMACPDSRLVSSSSARSSLGACSIDACRRRETAVRAWLTSSCRSRAIRSRSRSWASITARPASRRSTSRRAIMFRKAAASRLVSALSAPRQGSARPGSGARSARSISEMSSSSGLKRRCRSNQLAMSVATVARPNTIASRPPGRYPSFVLSASVATSTVTATSSRLTARTWARRERDFMRVRRPRSAHMGSSPDIGVSGPGRYPSYKPSGGLIGSRHLRGVQAWGAPQPVRPTAKRAVGGAGRRGGGREVGGVWWR